MEKELIEIHAIFSGRVQGVGFRYTAEYQGIKLGIAGTVRNLADGSVELVAQGTRKQVDKLVNLLTGPSGPGVVASVTKDYYSPSQAFNGFTIAF